MKKKILFLMILVLLTGCTANYNLTIENDNFIESIDISAPSYEKESLSSLINSNQLIKSTEGSDLVYEKSILEEDEMIKINLNHTFTIDEYNDSSSQKCFEKMKVKSDGDIYTIVADKFSCFGGFEEFADDYNINIKTNYNVINNNADKIKNNIYTWNINKKNYKDKSIIFQFEKKKKNFDYKNFFKPILISFVSSLVIIIIVKLIISYKNKQKTEM